MGILRYGSYDLGDIPVDKSFTATFADVSPWNYIVVGSIVSQGGFPGNDNDLTWSVRNKTNTSFIIDVADQIIGTTQDVRFEWAILPTYMTTTSPPPPGTTQLYWSFNSINSNNNSAQIFINDTLVRTDSVNSGQDVSGYIPVYAGDQIRTVVRTFGCQGITSFASSYTTGICAINGYAAECAQTAAIFFSNTYTVTANDISQGLILVLDNTTACDDVCP